MIGIIHGRNKNDDIKWIKLEQDLLEIQKDLDYNPDDPQHNQEYFGDVMAAIPEEVETPITFESLYATNIPP